MLYALIISFLAMRKKDIIIVIQTIDISNFSYRIALLLQSGFIHYTTFF